MNWYYLNDAGEVAGPVSDSTLAELRAINRLADNAQVCREGSEDWISLAEGLGIATTSASGVAIQVPVTKTTLKTTPPLPKGKNKYLILGVIGGLAAVVVGVIFVTTKHDREGVDSPSKLTVNENALSEPSGESYEFWRFRFGSSFSECAEIMKSLKNDGTFEKLDMATVAVGNLEGSKVIDGTTSRGGEIDMGGILSIPANSIYLYFIKDALTIIEVSSSFRTSAPANAAEMLASDMAKVFDTKSEYRIVENAVGNEDRYYLIQKGSLKVTIDDDPKRHGSPSINISVKDPIIQAPLPSPPPRTSSSKNDRIEASPEAPTSPTAQYLLGNKYEDGNGVTQDFKESAKWYKKAAEQNEPRALHALAMMHMKGQGVKKDEKEALYLLSKAANYGHHESQFLLGDMHKGLGNKVLACFWLSLAKSSSDKKISTLARSGMDSIAGQLTPDEIYQYVELFNSWKPGKEDTPGMFNMEKTADTSGSANKKVSPSKLPPYVNSLGMKFSAVEVPSGPSKGKAVLFSIWETRRRDYAAYADAIKSTDRSWESGNGSKGFLPENKDPDTPVTWINTEDAKGFCRWLTDTERRRGVIPEGAEYRLPTDHEWSCAVGLGAKEDPDSSAEEKNGLIVDIFPWGTEWPPATDVGNLGHAGQSKLLPVGKFNPGLYGLYDMAGNVSEIVVDPNAQSRFIEVTRGTSSLVDFESFVKSMFYSSARISLDLNPDSPTQKLMENGRCNDSGFRCVLFYNGDTKNLLALVRRSEVPSNGKPTTEKQPNGVQAPSKTIDAALPAFKIFQKSSLNEARECVRLLDEQLKQYPGNTRIQKVKSTITDIFREEALLVQARGNYQKAEKLLATEKRNLEITSKPSGLTGRVNQNEVAITRGKVNAAQTAMQSEKSKGEKSRSSLQKLLNDALSGLPEEERDALAPVWQQVAKRHQIKLSK